ncbi:hypothetical protein HaLaN_00757 [Haematococcus lacustris]|uniref:Uncharacterized protein n=1 Tax=Haematococcus lacustris TaxID=44745 RepID=A0A699YSU3_HAELA|nr:hypothetical protein HaLaN_00757 [Haematococcus lacustris]
MGCSNVGEPLHAPKATQTAGYYAASTSTVMPYTTHDGSLCGCLQLTLGLLEQMTAKSRIVFMSSEGEWPLAQVEASFKNIKGDTLKESGPVAYGTSKAYEVRGRSPQQLRPAGQG